jgi:hypothetical protein
LRFCATGWRRRFIRFRPRAKPQVRFAMLSHTGVPSLAISKTGCWRSTTTRPKGRCARLRLAGRTTCSWDLIPAANEPHPGVAAMEPGRLTPDRLFPSRLDSSTSVHLKIGGHFAFRQCHPVKRGISHAYSFPAELRLHAASAQQPASALPGHRETLPRRVFVGGSRGSVVPTVCWSVCSANVHAACCSSSAFRRFRSRRSPQPWPTA